MIAGGSHPIADAAAKGGKRRKGKATIKTHKFRTSHSRPRERGR